MTFRFCLSETVKEQYGGNIIGNASKEFMVDDIVNIGIGIPEMVSRFARKSGMLDMVTLTVESEESEDFRFQEKHLEQ